MESTVEVPPEYFMCPISLQIMKDPVTAVSGITYDRDSIEKWLFQGRNAMCPVTKQPLPRDSELTPNHTLRRLIQSWCADRIIIPTPKPPPLTKSYAFNLVRDLSVPSLRLKTLQTLDTLAAAENERNRKFLAEAGVAKELLTFIVTCYKEGSSCKLSGETVGLEQALNVLYSIRSFWIESDQFVSPENDNILDSISWILDYCSDGDVKTHALSVLRTIVAGDSATCHERLKPDLLKKLVSILREKNNIINLHGINSALHVMLRACSSGRNRVVMIDSGAVFELVELEINNSGEKKTTELVLAILCQLCCSADGRAQLVSHAAGIAAVSRTILKVSAAADDLALLILSSISRFSATSRVIQEMLRVGTVAKLCMVLQANCASHLKDNATEILRNHSDVWKDSPCVEVVALLP